MKLAKLDGSMYRMEAFGFSITVTCLENEELDVRVRLPGGTLHSHLVVANDTELIEALSVLPAKWPQGNRAAQILAMESRLQRAKDLYFA